MACSLPKRSQGAWTRRHLLGVAGAWLSLSGLGAAGQAETARRPLRMALTATYLYDLFSVHEQWRRYMERKLGRPVEFVRHASYREVIYMLVERKVDFAWICDYPYADNIERLSLVAVPIYKGRSYYQSYIIVPVTDQETTSILQLKGRVFAYAEPYSNTGYLTPRFLLREHGEDPASFFATTFFTRSHRKVVEAVAAELADGGAVGSYIWDTLSLLEPRLTNATRIIWKSPDYGFPPIVANTSVSAEDLRQVRSLLIGMAEDPEGHSLLSQLNLDGFIEGDRRLYRRVTRIMRELQNS